MLMQMLRRSCWPCVAADKGPWLRDLEPKPAGAMDGPAGVKLENHHVLRLDCSTGKAGAVRVDEVQRR